MPNIKAEKMIRIRGASCARQGKRRGKRDHGIGKPLLSSAPLLAACDRKRVYPTLNSWGVFEGSKWTRNLRRCAKVVRVKGASLVLGRVFLTLGLYGETNSEPYLC